MKVRCVSKNRDTKGHILNYTLQFEDGRVIQATTQDIKNELAANRYQFTNLQLDKIGRLVDKAEEKQPVQSKQKPVTADGDFYTIEDLIRNISPKGRKVRCHEEKTGKVYIGEGVCFHMDGEMAHSIIRVYLKETGYEMTVKLRATKDAEGFWKEYSDKFPLFPDSEDTVNKVVEFCKKNAEKYGFKLSFDTHGYKVNCKPNPAGQYTILAIGKSDERDFYKIRDNRDGKEYWNVRASIDVNAYHNDYTNVAMKRDELIFSRTIPVVNIGELLKKQDACIDKIKEEIRKSIPYGVTVTEDEVHVKEFKEFDELCTKVKKLWETLGVKQSFRDMLFNAVEDVMEYEEHTQTLYYGFLGDAGGDLMGEITYSYNPEDVRSCLKSLIDRYMECMEECSEIEAKRVAYDLVRTNIQHDFYINDDEEDDEWEDWD